MRAIRDELHKRDYRVVSNWIDAERPENLTGDWFMSPEGRNRLIIDLADIERSNIVVADVMEGIGRRGGMNIEIGIGYASKKTSILIGDPTQFGIFGHVFHKTFPDWLTAFKEYF